MLPLQSHRETGTGITKPQVTDLHPNRSRPYPAKLGSAARLLADTFGEDDGDTLDEDEFAGFVLIEDVAGAGCGHDEAAPVS